MNKYKNQSLNKKKWGIIKNELGKLERRYVCVTIKKIGKLIFEPTQVAKSFNTYFTKIAE
jgi:hypothetical protein